MIRRSLEQETWVRWGVEGVCQATRRAKERGDLEGVYGSVHEVGEKREKGERREREERRGKEGEGEAYIGEPYDFDVFDVDTT